MADRSWGYRALVGLMAAAALGAVIFGGYGLYTVLTGGTTDGTVDVNVVGEYDCEQFNGDPEVAHNTSYGVERTFLGGSVIDSFNQTRDGDSLRLTFVVDGGVVGTSARRADGTEIPVENRQEESRVVVVLEDRSPFRLWIDSVSDEATVSRTQLDICPPS